MAMEEFTTLSYKLEEIGEPEVRQQLARGVYAGRKREFVELWLRNKNEECSELRAAILDAREEDALSISRDSKEIAERALAISERDLAVAEKQAAEAARAAEAAERQASAAEETSKTAKRQARYAMWAAAIATIMALIAIRKDIEPFILWALHSIIG